MLLIIVTHFFAWKGINSFQISTVGVACFLFISGYLYGNKSIDNRKDWIKNRFNRVLVPFWILALVLSIYLIVKGNYQFALRQMIESFFCLQGIHSIIHFPFALGNGHLPGLAHCWFLTVIVLCYVGVAFLKNSHVEKFGDNHLGILLLFAILLHIAFCFVNISIGCFVIFFVGYFYRRIESPKMKTAKFVLISTLVMLVAVLFRVVLKQKIDGYAMYDFFVSPLASNICAIWCFTFVKYICQRKERISSITVTRGWKFWDNLTYPLYLTHFMFLKDPFDLSLLAFSSEWTELACFSVFSMATAIFLEYISKKIVGVCSNK